MIATPKREWFYKLKRPPRSGCVWTAPLGALIIGIIVFNACGCSWRGREHSSWDLIGVGEANSHPVLPPINVFIRYFTFCSDPNLSVLVPVFQVLSPNRLLDCWTPRNLRERA